MDLAITGRAWVGGRLSTVTIGIDDGRIVRVGARSVPADRELVFLDGMILPGAIDAHVHFRDPGATRKEDFASGTRAAAQGGVTTVLDMPNTDPPVVTRHAFARKLAIARRKAAVDFGLYAAPREDGALTLGSRPIAYKAYLGPTTGGLRVAPESLSHLFADATRNRVPVSFHAEDAGCIEEASRRVVVDGPESHARLRPARCELEAVRRLLPFVRTGLAHVAHVTTQAAARILVSSRASFEVTPHHLLLTEKDLARDVRLKCNPPLRPSTDRAFLWRTLSAGKAILASDHAPHLPSEKRGVLSRVEAGVPGVETMVPLLMARVAAGVLPLRSLVAAACERPADRFGLARKGRIEPGRDADLVVYDPKTVATVEARRLSSKCGWSPFEGFSAVFPTHVFSRGRQVVEDGRFVGKAGWGREVRRG
ncbi:MAG TPA: dihydroorotase [Candidatus Thermoplasmatota archaeon]|nr:dihydroorotase [Candidatus Thermoplasmatota archaeon]